jgi:hypothetical protein
MTNDTTNGTDEAIFMDETMSLAAFRSYVTDGNTKKLVRPSLVLVAPYTMVEYFNSPVGLIVFAHHNTIAGQVDGIHPAALSDSIVSPHNIIEPLTGSGDNAMAYNVHYMTRRSQGSLVLKAFGRTIQGGEEEAPWFKTGKSFQLEVYNLKTGVVIGAIENEDRVCVIRPVPVAREIQSYEVAA